MIKIRQFFLIFIIIFLLAIAAFWLVATMTFVTHGQLLLAVITFITGLALFFTAVILSQF